MTWVFNPVTRQVDDVDETVATAYEQLLNRLAADPAAFPLGLPPDADRLLAGTLDAARTVASAQTPKQGEMALRGATAAADAWVETVGAHEAQPAPARQRRTPPRLIRPWTDRELARIQDGLPGRYQLFTDLGATLGLREGESFGCCLEDFDDSMANYFVRQQVKRIPGGRAYAAPKHERERSVPVPPDLRDLIRQHITVYGATQVTLPWALTGRPRTRTLLLTGMSGASLDRAYFGRLFTDALVSARIEATRENKTHMLRHLAASRWIAAGADVLMVSELLGHADIATTQAYIRRLKTHDQRTRRVVAKAAPKPRRPPKLPSNVIDFAARKAGRNAG